MPDENANLPETEPSPAEEPVYTETVVEYSDNRRTRAVLGIILVVAFFILIGLSYAVIRLTPGAAPPSEASLPRGIEWVRSIYGWGNSPQEALRSPTDVAIAPDGTIWAISGHDTIAGFNPDGTTKRVIKPKNVASLEGIDIAENGDIFVTDFGGQVVQFSETGTFLDQWKVQLPNEIDVRDGKIAVAAASGVAVFTSEGKILAQWGSRGPGEDQFDLPHGIAQAEDGTIFVSDTQNARVRAFTPAGRLIWSLGLTPDRTKPGANDVRDQKREKGPFLIPSGMALDGNGRVVLVDPFKFQIIVVDPKTGKIAKEAGKNGKPGRNAIYGDFGQQDGLFAYPTGIAYDPARDWFAVADTANNRVQIVRLPGSGGNILAPIIGAWRLPMCLFALPLILLLAAIVVAVMRRRRERELPADEGAGPEGSPPVPAPTEA